MAGLRVKNGDLSLGLQTGRRPWFLVPAARSRHNSSCHGPCSRLHLPLRRCAARRHAAPAWRYHCAAWHRAQASVRPSLVPPKTVAVLPQPCCTYRSGMGLCAGPRATRCHRADRVAGPQAGAGAQCHHPQRLPLRKTQGCRTKPFCWPEQAERQRQRTLSQPRGAFPVTHGYSSLSASSTRRSTKRHTSS